MAWACLGIGCVGDTAGSGRADAEACGESLRRERGDCFPARNTPPAVAGGPGLGRWSEDLVRRPSASSQIPLLPKMCNPGRSGVSHPEGKLPVYPVASTFP